MMKAVIMASGEGTNAENIVSFFKNQKDQVEIVGIITDRPKAGVLEKAKKWLVPSVVIERKAREKSSHERQVVSQITKYENKRKLKII